MLAAFMAACIDVNAGVNGSSQSVAVAKPSSSTTRIEGVALTTGIAGRTANKTSRTITMAGNSFSIASIIYDDQYLTYILLLSLERPLSSPNE
jgi:hypothetical protein